MSYLANLAPHVYDRLEDVEKGRDVNCQAVHDLYVMDFLSVRHAPGAILFVLSDDGRKALKERSTK